jgi:transmembrane sensor
MGKERISYLLHEYAAGRASKNEVEEMFELLKSVENEDVLRNLIMAEGTDNDLEINLPQQKWDEMWMAVRSGSIERRKSRIRTMQWIRIAAAVLVVAAAGLYFFTGKREQASQPVADKRQYENDVAPGGNKALLTLADGSTIVLDNTQKGPLAQQGSTTIIKLDEGQLAYQGVGKATGEMMFNTISTPRGGQYQMMLPDGSRVWLNASSSIRFPAAFPEKERRVELTGEAYFEIASLPLTTLPKGRKGTKGKIPFVVAIIPPPGGRGAEVEVMGTHFNVMAYQNEQNITTTLLEGSVKVKYETGHSAGAGSKYEVLKPGQQARMKDHALSVIKDVNTDQVIAWKNGFFRFKDTDIKELMRQVERWYDVEVAYQTNRGDQDYTGIVSRSANLSSVLQMLELTGTVHFRVEGRKITVLP